MDCNCLSLLVAVLSCLVTVLMGWNIYNVVDMKKELKRIDELEEKLNSKADKKKTVPPDINERGRGEQ